MDRRESGLGALAFAVALPFVVAAVLLPGEFTHYKRWLELGTDETGLRVAVLLAIASKSLAALIALGAALVLTRPFVGARGLRLLSVLSTLGLFGFLLADLEVQRHTGNNLSDFVPHLFDADTFVWAGQAFDVVPASLRVIGSLLVALVPAVAVAWLLEGCVARADGRLGRRILTSSLALTLMALGAAPLAQRSLGAPGPLFHLNDRMPWAWLQGLAVRSESFGGLQSEMQELFAGSTLAKFRVARVRAQHAPPADKPPVRPDILLVVVESLRADALDEETMPELWDWSQHGLRADEHYATSNASHYGLFALLYGRSPLAYFETLDAGERPALPAQLREWGYSTHFVSCTDIVWRGMERFLGPQEFSVERLRDASLDACDRGVTTRVAALLEPGDRAPRFILAFLMSTHFGYHYPTGPAATAAPFQPALDPPNALDLDADRDAKPLRNRYRNSAHYLDSLLGALRAGPVDPKKTLLVVTGDHGESLFEDGTLAHSSRLSEAQTRVPFVMLGPGVPAGRRTRGPTDHSQLFATLAARLGEPVSTTEASFGRDLLEEDRPRYAALVHAKARRGGSDRVALASGDQRYSFLFDAEGGSLRFLGKLGERGRVSREPLTTAEGATAVEWLEDFLGPRSSPLPNEEVPRTRPTTLGPEAPDATRRSDPPLEVNPS